MPVEAGDQERVSSYIRKGKKVVIFRPHIGMLEESMKRKKEFSSLLYLFKHLCEEYNGAFDVNDIYVTFYGNDDRIGWETYMVLTREFWGEHGTVVLGFLTFE